jgi:carlactone synthase/all-trans-10'-apo-beta-carotenal 13,14-cleaving dioxygenase
MGNAIAKIDTQAGSAITWHRPGGAPGEPRFVGRPGATEEDDGVLVVPCMGADGRSFVAVLDAKDLKEVATVQLPFAVPNRFHGIWINN